MLLERRSRPQPLAARDTGPEAQRHVELTRSAGEYLLHLVGDPRDLSRIEAGAWTLQARAMELAPVK